MELLTAAQRVADLVLEEADVSDEIIDATEKLDKARADFEAGLGEVQGALDSLADAVESVKRVLLEKEVISPEDELAPGSEIEPEGETIPPDTDTSWGDEAPTEGEADVRTKE